MPIPAPEGFGDAKEGFDPLPAGKYLVEVTDSEEVETGPDSKTTREYGPQPMIKLELQCQEEEYEGRRLWTNLVFSPKSLGMSKAALRALNYKVEELESADLVIDADELVGLRALAVVTQGKNPKTQEDNNSVKRLLPLDSEVDSELP